MSKKQKLYKIFAATLVALIVAARPSFAEGTVCAAIMPCDQNGEVLTEWRDSECFTQYQINCSRFHSQTLKDTVSACQEEREQTVESLKLDLKKAERRIKQLLKTKSVK